MGAEDNLHAAIANVALVCVAGPCLAKVPDKSFTHPGVFGNFIIHGILGAMYHQGKTFGNEFETPYHLSIKASRYLPLPCLMADIYRANRELSGAHLASGLLPFAMALAGKDNAEFGNLCVAGNIISLAYYSFEHNKQMGWATACCGLFAYFVSLNVPMKIAYPLSLAAMAYCIDRLWFESR